MCQTRGHSGEMSICSCRRSHHRVSKPVRRKFLQSSFLNKIKKIRLSTVGSPQAVIQQRDTPTLCVFRTVLIDEITKIVNESCAKHCSFDPAPTWLTKQLCPQLAQTIENISNASFAAGVLPAYQKHAIVKPR